MKKLFILCLFLSLFMFFNANIFSAEPRNIMLLFDIKEYNKKIENTVDDFFENFLKSNDQVIIMTPAGKLYSYSSKTLSSSKNNVQDNIKNTLRKHTSSAGTNYRNIYTQMLDIVEQMRAGEDIRNLLTAYENNRNQLAGTRKISEKLILNFANIFKRSKKVTGKTKNYIFLFFHKEYRPIPNKSAMNTLRENTEIAFRAMEILLEEKSKIEINTEKVSRELNDSGVKLYFTYIEPEKRSTQRYQLIDNSGNFYSAISDIAKNTGGVKLSTSQPKSIFEKIKK